jgi:hypothetical protein
MPSYHDLYITTATLPRTNIFYLPYGYAVHCSRTGGWCLIFCDDVVAGEYEEPGRGLRLDVDGYVVVDSLDPHETFYFRPPAPTWLDRILRRT